MKGNKILNLVKAFNLSYKKMVGLGVVVVLSSAIKVILAYMYQHIINHIQFLSFHEIAIYFIIILGIIIVSGILLNTYATKRRLIAQEVTYYLQKNLLNKKIYGTLRSVEKEQIGEWLTKISSDCSILADFYPATVLGVVKGIVPFLLGLIYGCIASYQLTIVILFCSFFAIFIPKLFLKRMETKQEEKQVSDEGVRNLVMECFHNVALIQSYQAIPFFINKFEKQYDKFSNHSIENAKLTAKIESVNIGIGFLMNTIWMVAGIFMIMNQSLTIGGFVGFMVLTDAFNWPFFELPSIVNDFAKAKVSFQRLFETKYEKTEEGIDKTTSSNKVTIFIMEYEFDEESKQYFENLTVTWMSMNQNKKFWQTISADKIQNTKVHGGASRSVSRIPAKAISKPPFFIKPNVKIFGLQLRKQQLFFLPNKLLVVSGTKVGAVNYNEIRMGLGTTRFIEDDVVPKDATVVGKTWLKVNKNGTRDKRFKDNRQVPICEYGVIVIESGMVLYVELMCSNSNTIEQMRTYAEKVFK